MILCHSDVTGWVVIYQYQGMTTRSMFLDKVRADAYAVNYHGVIKSLHIPVDVQPKAELQIEKTPEAPWNGETQVEAL